MSAGTTGARAAGKQWILWCILALLIVFSCFFRISIVEGESMINTLEDQDKLLLSTRLYTVECGDIIVVNDDTTELGHPIIKRVIALGGQTVKFTRDAIYVDGVKLDEPYVYTEDHQNIFGEFTEYKYTVYPSEALEPLLTSSEDGVYFEIRVPDGEIFVMGDHRNNSKDSRDFGTLHEDKIVGEVILRLLPFSKLGKIE